MIWRKNRFFLYSSAFIIVFFLITGFVVFQITNLNIQSEIKDKLRQIRVFKERELLSDFRILENLLATTTDRAYVKTFLESSKRNQTEISQWLKTHRDSYHWRAKIASERHLDRSSEGNRLLNQLSPVSLFLQAYFLEGSHPAIPQLDNLNYFKQHTLLHSRMRTIAERFQLGDIFLIDSEGVITYSVKKDLLYGANLTSGVFLNSRIAEAYRWSRAAPPGSIHFFDFAPILYGQAAPTALLATPIIDKNVFLGTLVIQISLERIDDLLSNQHDWRNLGLRETGEVLVIGPEGLMRNNSRFYLANPTSFFTKYPRNSPFAGNLENIRASKTTALNAGFSDQLLRAKLEYGELDGQILNDYLDEKVVASIENLVIPGGIIWTLMVKMNTDEIRYLVGKRSLPFLIFFGALLILCLGIVYFIAARASRSEDLLNQKISDILGRNVFVSVPPQKGHFNLFSQSMNRLLQTLEFNIQNLDLFKKAIDLLPESIFIIRSNSRLQSLEIRNINKVACELIGESESHLINSDIKDKLELDYQSLFEFKRRQTSESFNILGYIKQSSGNRVPIDFTWQTVFRTPEESYFAVIGQDLRKQKSDTERIQLLSSLLHESQSLSKQGAFRWDIRTGELICTSQMLRILGLKAEEAINYDMFRSLVLIEDISTFENALEESRQHLSNFSVEYRIRKKNSAEIVWIKSLGHTEYDDYGNALFMYGVTEDITELRRHEQTLISAKNEAVKSSQAKSEFLARMSHEIRTPMNAIMGMAELLMETKLSPDQTYYINIFCKAGEVLMTLINDILDISKIEAGEVSVENIPFDIEALMNDVSAIMKPRAQEKGLLFSYEITPGISRKLMGDPTKLRQVLINLVGNSLKFTSEGSIKVSVVKNPSKKDSLLVCVTDSGVGIPLSKQHMIFQKFSQADSSITRMYGGTGLGLAISKSLIELMGGQIWFKSRENVGTTFFLTIPYREQIYNPTLAKSYDFTEVEHVNNGPKIRPQGRKLKVLVVDDTEDNRTLFTHYLKNGPYEIIESENGLDAVDKIKSGQFDIVFMDVQMPEMDGYTATRKIRQWEDEVHRRHIPIIALTAHALSEDRHKSLKAGCDDHIAKPFKKDTLLGVINRFSM